MIPENDTNDWTLGTTINPQPLKRLSGRSQEYRTELVQDLTKIRNQLPKCLRTFNQVVHLENLPFQLSTISWGADDPVAAGVPLSEASLVDDRVVWLPFYPFDERHWLSIAPSGRTVPVQHFYHAEVLPARRPIRFVVFFLSGDDI